MKTIFIICDNSANNGKTYIGDGNRNVELLENAVEFSSKQEAQDYIDSHDGWAEWAFVSLEEIEA